MASLVALAIVVSIHAPARGATGRLAGYRPDGGFNSTRPRGARPGLICPVSRCRIGFSKFTRAREGRDVLQKSHCIQNESFNSRRPRGARPSALRGNGLRRYVSIHAPARARLPASLPLPGISRVSISRAREGRDKRGQNLQPDVMVSIHAPARGANPTVDGVSGHVQFVSIHAPARARPPRRSPPEPRQKFQFTRPRGARLTAPPYGVFVQMFQFTRPRGARRDVLRPRE